MQGEDPARGMAEKPVTAWGDSSQTPWLGHPSEKYEFVNWDD